jgi:signal transduction histidine kinase
LLQESLANAFRHAKCAGCVVELKGDTDFLVVEVRDKGPGFDTTSTLASGRLGLNGMRQRVEVLGGSFELSSIMGVGTTIRVRLPLASQGNENE